MKQNWSFKVLLVLCLLIPLAFFPKTFDQFGTAKMAIFLFLSSLLTIGLFINYKQFTSLPKYLLFSFGFFLIIQFFQTIRLSNIGLGFFGDYGQSESFIVQIAFVTVCLASYLYLEDEIKREKIRTVILLTIYFVSIYGITQYIYGDPITNDKITRVKSFFGDPNSLGIFLVLTLPVIIWEFKCHYHHWQGYLIGGGIFIGIIALFLSFSRTAWLGFIVSLTILIYWTLLQFFQHRPDRKKDFAFISIVILIVIAGIICGEIITYFQPVSHTDYTLRARISSIINRHDDSGRLLIWSSAWKTFRSSPLIGYGIGSFQPNFHYFESKTAIQHWGPEQNIRQVHNEPLHYLATQGVLGLLSYLGLLLALFWAAKVSGLFSDSIHYEKMVLWAAIFGYLVCMQFAYPLIHYSFIFWLYLGMLVRFQYPAPSLQPLRVKPILMITLAAIIGIVGVISFSIFRADLLYRKALFEARSHRYSQSFTHYQQAISLTPWIYHYHYRYAVTLLRAAQWFKENEPDLTTKYLSLARVNLQTLIKVNPSRYELNFLLGQVAESQADWSRASNYYRQALKLFPNNYKISFRLAKMELLMGNQKEFLKAFQVGLKVDPFHMREMLQTEGLELR